MLLYKCTYVSHTYHTSSHVFTYIYVYRLQTVPCTDRVYGALLEAATSSFTCSASPSSHALLEQVRAHPVHGMCMYVYVYVYGAVGIWFSNCAGFTLLSCAPTVSSLSFTHAYASALSLEILHQLDLSLGHTHVYSHSLSNLISVSKFSVKTLLFSLPLFYSLMNVYLLIKLVPCTRPSLQPQSLPHPEYLLALLGLWTSAPSSTQKKILSVCICIHFLLRISIT